ncbi:hypothetical protein [Herbaspirillum seropedicae]|uniref:hypothetical protein n=1 Tax=Herbaspirillum seropedicae TaxID=964 RepID=UPI003D99456C
MIDEVLNRVIEEAALDAELSAGSLGRCADYALVGARVLSLLLNHKYEALAGGEIIDCGNGVYVVLFPSRKSRRHARLLSDLKDYHCWIQASHRSSNGTENVEVIDFTSRHDQLWAEKFNVAYTKEQSPRYLWEWQENIPPVPLEVRPQLSANRKTGNWMWTDPDCMRLMKKYEKDYDAVLSELTAKVLHALADSIEIANANVK